MRSSGSRSSWASFAALTVVGCMVYGVRGRSRIPVNLVIGSALSMFGESLVIPGMDYWYPAIGQITAYKAHGHSVPLFGAFA
jgi:hypothetical protein